MKYDPEANQSEPIEPALTSAEAEELEAFAQELQQDLAGESWQGWSGGAPELPAQARSVFRQQRFAIAAALLLAVALGNWQFWQDEAGLVYSVSVQGEGVAAGDSGSQYQLQAGQRIETQAGQTARIAVPQLGEVELEAGSALRVGNPQEIDGEHYLELERGAALATILAKPRAFQLGTPAGIAVDLGCVYRAEIGEDGRTQLSVISGAVSFEKGGRKVYVPQGASVWANTAVGPGTPLQDDAAPEFARIVQELDTGGTLRIDTEDFRALFELARPVDALSIWHLMVHAQGNERYVYAKLLDRLVPMPEDFEPDDCVLLGTAGNLAWRAKQPWL